MMSIIQKGIIKHKQTNLAFTQKTEPLYFPLKCNTLQIATPLEKSEELEQI